MNHAEELEALAVRLDLAAAASEAKAKLHVSQGEVAEARREMKRQEDGLHFADVCRQSAKELRKREKRGKFTVPTLPEVKSFIIANQGDFPGWPMPDIEAAYDHYEAVGWKIGGKPMQDWQAAFRNCYRRWAEKNPGRAHQNGSGRKDDPKGWAEWLKANDREHKPYVYAPAHWKSDFAQRTRGEGI